MKHIITILALVSGSAYAFCPSGPNFWNCWEQEMNQQRQQQQMNQMLEQQQRLNNMNYHQSQQPANIRQQCYQNVFGVIECR